VGSRGAAGSGKHGDPGQEGRGSEDGPPAAVDILSKLRQTPSLAPLADRLALAAAYDAPVLLTGETGTGKTHLARLIHANSPRRGLPLLVVPCGALAAGVIMSELFGHVRGAFTGADRGRVGKFGAAGSGTLLLDEIDILSLATQVALLRVIETGEFEPLGSNDTQLCQARVIAASNWDLEGAVAEGKFRQDLYYRLNVLSFYLPPLRERPQDVRTLARGMAARFSQKFRKGLFDINPDAMAALEGFPWPGNIRQLENVVQQAVLLGSGPELLPEHLPPAVQAYLPATNSLSHHPAGSGEANDNGSGHAGGSDHTNGQWGPDSLQHNREVMERNVIQRALANNGYSRKRTAQALGISRVSLYKKLKKYGIG
jgi:DNA-binding NtrC family response regulator